MRQGFCSSRLRQSAQVSSSKKGQRRTCTHTQHPHASMPNGHSPQKAGFRGESELTATHNCPGRATGTRAPEEVTECLWSKVKECENSWVTWKRHRSPSEKDRSSTHSPNQLHPRGILSPSGHGQERRPGISTSIDPTVCCVEDRKGDTNTP